MESNSVEISQISVEIPKISLGLSTISVEMSTLSMLAKISSLNIEYFLLKSKISIQNLKDFGHNPRRYLLKYLIFWFSEIWKEVLEILSISSEISTEIVEIWTEINEISITLTKIFDILTTIFNILTR